MLRLWVTCLLFVVVGVVGADEAMRLVALSDLTPEEARYFFEEKASWVVEVPEGTCLPVAFFLTGSLVQIQSETASRATVKQTFYLRRTEGGFLFSVDLSHWKTLEEFVTGTLSASLMLDSTTPLLQLGGRVGLRPSAL